VAAAAYHASLSAKERTDIQRKWETDEIPIIISTIAFGMGIDVRHTIDIRSCSWS